MCPSQGLWRSWHWEASFLEESFEKVRVSLGSILCQPPCFIFKLARILSYGGGKTAQPSSVNPDSTQLPHHPGGVGESEWPHPPLKPFYFCHRGQGRVCFFHMSIPQNDRSFNKVIPKLISTLFGLYVCVPLKVRWPTVEVLFPHTTQ